MSELAELTALELEAPAAAPGGQAWYETPDPRRWVALATALTALFMSLLDVSIVSVAIPAIRTNLAANDADIQFVVAGYGLAYAVILITGGRLGDIFGRKRLLMLGMGGFVLASALCGLAQSALMLDLSRVLQGGMAALMYPQVLSIVQVTFPPHERARVFGFLGAVIGIATIAGPLVGGLIIRDDLTGGSWRWIFLVNLPIGIVALAAASRVVTEFTRAQRHPARPRRRGHRHRGAGAPGLPPGGGAGGRLAALDVRLHGHQPAWCFSSSSSTSAPSRRARSRWSNSRSSGSPPFASALLISMTLLAGIPAFFFTFSLLVQVGLGFSALNAGLTTVPWSLGAAVASIMSSPRRRRGSANGPSPRAPP